MGGIPKIDLLLKFNVRIILILFVKTYVTQQEDLGLKLLTAVKFSNITIKSELLTPICQISMLSRNLEQCFFYAVCLGENCYSLNHCGSDSRVSDQSPIYRADRGQKRGRIISSGDSRNQATEF